jgi:hypothetical protein
MHTPEHVIELLLVTGAVIVLFRDDPGVLRRVDIEPL